MNSFRFHNPTVLYYGKGQLQKHLAAEVKAYGRKVLLVYGGGSIKKSGLYDTVRNLLTDAALQVFELPGVEPNPRLSTVRKGIDICRTEGIELVLAVGGGSVLDCSKAIVLGTKYPGDVWDIFAKHIQPEEALPLGTVLTMAATGSEMNSGGVITNWDTKEKLGGGSPAAFPKFSFCDAENTYTVPRDQTVNGMSDILAHCFEHYFHATPETPLQQRLIESVIATLVEYAPKVLANPTDFHARETVMYCSTMALNGMISMGLVGDWACHGIEHEISAIYDIPHGGGLAIVFPNWMDNVVDVNPQRFAQLGERVFGVERNGRSDKEVALDTIAKVREFFGSIGAPQRLADYGIGGDDIQHMAAQAVRYGHLGNFKKLTQEDVAEILRNSL